ncbi:hypothetical protein DXG03_002982 [Asterophora parasitica]|uniref:Uncharacterized protein n=1 Tax=Asterophora parasitica TaxID=117018 RepID=A0A9P7G3U6_9AGAR|nr:hypothetical protein DXG03_002982 [Asterophora parasitica]
MGEELPKFMRHLEDKLKELPGSTHSTHWPGDRQMTPGKLRKPLHVALAISPLCLLFPKTLFDAPGDAALLEMWKRVGSSKPASICKAESIVWATVHSVSDGSDPLQSLLSCLDQLAAIDFANCSGWVSPLLGLEGGSAINEPLGTAHVQMVDTGAEIPMASIEPQTPMAAIEPQQTSSDGVPDYAGGTSDGGDIVSGGLVSGDGGMVRRESADQEVARKADQQMTNDHNIVGYQNTDDDEHNEESLSPRTVSRNAPYVEVLTGDNHNIDGGGGDDVNLKDDHNHDHDKENEEMTHASCYLRKRLVEILTMLRSTSLTGTGDNQNDEGDGGDDVHGKDGPDHEQDHNDDHDDKNDDHDDDNNDHDNSNNKDNNDIDDHDHDHDRDRDHDHDHDHDIDIDDDDHNRDHDRDHDHDHDHDHDRNHDHDDNGDDDNDDDDDDDDEKAWMKGRSRGRTSDDASDLTTDIEEMPPSPGKKKADPRRSSRIESWTQGKPSTDTAKQSSSTSTKRPKKKKTSSTSRPTRVELGHPLLITEEDRKLIAETHMIDLSTIEKLSGGRVEYAMLGVEERYAYMPEFHVGSKLFFKSTPHWFGRSCQNN